MSVGVDPKLAGRVPTGSLDYLLVVPDELAAAWLKWSNLVSGVVVLPMPALSCVSVVGLSAATLVVEGCAGVPWVV